MMVGIRKAILAVEQADQSLNAAKTALTALPESLSGEGGKLVGCIDAAHTEARRVVGDLSARLDEMEREIFGGQLLQVQFDAGKKPVKLVVNRPNNNCMMPHLTHQQWGGLQALLGMPPKHKIRARTSFPILVLNRFGVTEMEIPPTM